MLTKVLILVSPSSNSLNFDRATNMNVPMGPSFASHFFQAFFSESCRSMFSMRVLVRRYSFGVRRHQLQRLHPRLPGALPIARLPGELGVLHQRVKLLLLGERHSWSNRSPRRMEKPGIKLD